MSDLIALAESIPGEDILPDDYPIYGDYLYVVDGEPYVSDFHGITARELRLRLKAKEIRRCNISARRALSTSGQKP